MTIESRLIIDNEARPASGGATFERRYAQEGHVVTTGAAATVEDAVAAVGSAARAFPGWAATGPTKRRETLLKAADLLEARSGEFIQTMMAEISAPADWAGFNVFLTTQCLREAAGLASQLVGETIPNDRGGLSMTVRQPAGVVLSMAPGNAPGVLGMCALAYPIVCGNTVVFRASEGSPRTHQMLVEVLHDAGLPATVLDHVAPGMEIHHAETFAPITTMVRVNGYDEAIATANDTEYGLAAAVHGTDSFRTLQAAMAIQAGHVHINGATVQNDANAPFGGMKNSGYGRFDGRTVIREFTGEKWITIGNPRQGHAL